MLMRLTDRIIVLFAVIFFALIIWLRDVEQAYMRATKLTRVIFTEPSPEANFHHIKY